MEQLALDKREIELRQKKTLEERMIVLEKEARLERFKLLKNTKGSDQINRAL